MKKKVLISLYLIAAIFTIGELVGRWYGLTNFPLFVASDKFEYISKPNQQVRIYRNRFAINAYSMRSNLIEKTDTTVVLLFGDSVLYGGNQIDQDSLASTLLEKQLSQTFNRPIRVLNISSKSWGPDNAAAYVRQYGTFDADMIILVFSSGDAHDNMVFASVVGNDPDYPDENVTFAWEVIWEKGRREIMNRLTKKDTKTINQELRIAEAKSFNSGFAYFDSLTKAQHIPLAVFLHKTIDEIRTGKREKGGQEIIAFCKQHNVPLLQSNEQPNMYLDQIHLNNSGQKFLAIMLFPIVCKYLKL